MIPLTLLSLHVEFLQLKRRTALLQEAVGIDVELLNEIQVKILEVYSLRALSCCEPLLESSYTLCASSMETALYKATNHLLDDLSRNARLLGTPERWAICK